jgi:hypothetical protein
MLSATAAPAQEPSSSALSNFLADWDARASAARAAQPDWTSPIATSTGILEQRFRFELLDQHAGNGSDTVVLDGGKGLDLIVGDTEEVQIGLAPYDIRSARAAGNSHAGFGDWTFLRLKQRLASSPADRGDYVVATWLQIQAPTGIAAYSNGSWTFLPTLAFGKGWGPVDVQATIGGVIPTSNVGVLGRQLQTNIALQYHFGGIFWPELDANWTYYPDGQRAGLHQLFLTPGFTMARFHFSQKTTFTIGVGYQVAVSPQYRAKPLTPSYGNALLFSSRINF